MERSRIAILCNFPIWIAKPDFPVFKGHYATWLPSLYQAFENSTENFEIHWVILNKEVKQTLRFTSKGQIFHVIPRTKKTIGLYTFYLYDRRRVAEELKLIAPHLVHTWGTEDCYGLCGKDYKGLWIHSVQGLLTVCKQRGQLSRFERHHAFYEKTVLRTCKHITTESPWAKERVQEIAPASSPILWDYAVEDYFYKTERHITETPTCIYCGSDTPIKNVDLLINAFSDKRLAHIKLKLAGVSPQQRDNLPSNIIPLGRISREQIAKEMSESWCLIHPSKADTGPTALKEARVVGLPCIVTTECGAKQYVENEKSGFIIRTNDLESLINCVLHITQDKNIALDMGYFEHDACKKHLSKETMCNQIIRLYTQIINQ